MSFIRWSHILGFGCALTLGVLPRTSSAIVDGVETTIEFAPFAVAIMKIVPGTYSTLLCGGVLVAPDWVLTSAPCATEIREGNQLQNFKVVVATTDVGHEPAPSNSFAIAKIIVYPDYNKPAIPNNCAALFKLSKGITRSLKSAAIDLATAAEITQAIAKKSQLTTLGWGAPGEDQPLRTPNNVLRQFSLTLNPQAQCKTKLGSEYVEATMFCGSYDQRFPREGGFGCNGDLGSAMFLWTGTTSGSGAFVPGKKLVGIVSSWGQGCARPDKPDVYVSIPSIAPWIKTTMAENK